MLAVAKKKTQEVKADERAGRRTAPIQVDLELARWVRTIASHDGIHQTDLVTPILKPVILSHYKRVQAEIEQNLKKQE